MIWVIFGIFSVFRDAIMCFFVDLGTVRDELVNLMKTDEGQTLTEEQILNCAGVYKNERMSLEREFLKGQDGFEELKNRQRKYLEQMEEVRQHNEREIRVLLQKQDELAASKAELKSKFKSDYEDMEFKLKMVESQQKSLKGKIQKTQDDIDIKNHEIHNTLSALQCDYEKFSKKAYFKKCRRDKVQEDLTNLKENIQIIKDKQAQKKKKSLSTLRRTKTSFYKSTKSIKESP